MARVRDDAERCRELAEEERTVAATLKNDEARRIMLGIAEKYERLANHAEKKVRRPGQNRPVWLVGAHTLRNLADILLHYFSPQ